MHFIVCQSWYGAYKKFSYMVIIIKRLILKINDYITTFRFAIVQSRSFTQITLPSKVTNLSSKSTHARLQTSFLQCLVHSQDQYLPQFSIRYFSYSIWLVKSSSFSSAAKYNRCGYISDEKVHIDCRNANSTCWEINHQFLEVQSLIWKLLLPSILLYII
jgi:hypothetical protein